jgi:Mor family transcriptional regulator
VHYRARQIKDYIGTKKKYTIISFAELVGIIGPDVALKLCARFPGRVLPSPTHVLRAKRDVALIKDWENGSSIPEICMKYNMKRQNVYVILKRYIIARDSDMLPPKGEFE